MRIRFTKDTRRSLKGTVIEVSDQLGRAMLAGPNAKGDYYFERVPDNMPLTDIPGPDRDKPVTFPCGYVSRR